MGYNTSFRGKINLTPPLTEEQTRVIRLFAETRHESANGGYPHDMPTIWCNLTATKDGTALVWTGNEKSYSMVEWASYLIKNFLRPNGVIADGELDAWGEEHGDHWKLVVRNNVVKTEQL